MRIHTWVDSTVNSLAVLAGNGYRVIHLERSGQVNVFPASGRDDIQRDFTMKSLILAQDER